MRPDLDELKVEDANRRTLALLKWLTEDVFVDGAVATLVVRVPDQPGVELFYSWGEHILDTRAALRSIAANVEALERIVLMHSSTDAHPAYRCLTEPPGAM